MKRYSVLPALITLCVYTAIGEGAGCKSGYSRDPNDCSKFFQCSNGVKHRLSCPPGLRFNPAINVCDWPRNVDCVIGPSTTGPSPTGSSTTGPSPTAPPNICTNAADGDYAHPSDCSQYVTCSNGVSHVRQCPSGLRFNPKKKYCDWPRNVPCGNGPSTTGPSTTGPSTTGPSTAGPSPTAPICNLKCPVGRPSPNCDGCICDQHTLTGRVTSLDGQPLGKANVSLAETLHTVLAQTNASGHFIAVGVCAVSQLILVRRSGYVPLTKNSTVTSATTSTLEARLENAVPPIITVHPQSKIRFPGQNVTLCCDGAGNPQPKIEWFKDGTKLDGDIYNGKSLFVPSVQAGDYRCRVVNKFGAEFSKMATITVADPAKPSCSATPGVQLTLLPPGCVSSTGARRVNIGSCNRNPCPGNSEGCRDRNSCCEAVQTSSIVVRCATGVFPMERVVRCGCKLCGDEQTVVSGVAVSILDGTPMKFGEVLLQGKLYTRTDNRGRFQIKVPTATERLVVTFRDNSKKFAETTIVIPFVRGQEVFYKALLQYEDKPVEFNATEEVEVALGHTAGKPPLAFLQIPAGNLLTRDGSPYTGQATLRMTFTDPRNRDDVITAPGDFTTVDASGEERSLQTYGMLRLRFEDDKGQQLDARGSMTLFVDPKQIDIPASGNESSTSVRMWWLNEETGRWMELGRLTLGERNTGGRKKRAILPFWIGIIPADKYRYMNIDDYTQRCYTRVRAVDGIGTGIRYALVTSVFGTPGGRFTGYSVSYTNRNADSSTCVQVWCNSQAYLQANTDGNPLAPVPAILGSLPQVINANIVQSSGLIRTSAYNYAADPSPPNGPVYRQRASPSCFAANSNTSKHFLFRQQQLTFTAQSPSDFGDSCRGPLGRAAPLCWYPTVPPRYCFLKVRVRLRRFIDGDFQSSMLVMAESFRANQTDRFGFTVKQMVKTRVNKIEYGVACLEFKCDGLQLDPSELTFVNITVLTGRFFGSTRLTPTLKTYQQTVRTMHPAYPPNPPFTRTRASFYSGVFGAGLYEGVTRDEARGRCNMGVNRGLGDPVDANITPGGYAVEFGSFVRPTGDPNRPA